MRVALDTNVIGYAEGLDDAGRQSRANQILRSIDPASLIVPLQVAAELHRLIMRRRRIGAAEASAAVERWLALCPHHPKTAASTFDLALSLAHRHDVQIFDAIILASTVEAGGHLLLSEDMQDGFVWRGVTVANPFAERLHPLLADTLRR
jgi:predicted nucleic acid-binding protein